MPMRNKQKAGCFYCGSLKGERDDWLTLIRGWHYAGNPVQITRKESLKKVIARLCMNCFKYLTKEEEKT